MGRETILARGAARPDVLFVITDLQVGGSERQIALLALALAASGMAVAVYSFLDGPVREQIEAAGVEVIVGAGLGNKAGVLTGLLGVPRLAVHLFGFLLRRRPRIVHFFLPAAYLVGAPLAALARVPVRVMSRRSLNTYQRRPMTRIVEQCWHRFTHAVLGNSRSVVDQLREEGVSSERIGLIYNGLDADRMLDDGSFEIVRHELRLTPAALVICIVANLIPYKGHRDLIDALGLAASRLPSDWRLLLVGRDDGFGLDLIARVRELGLQENVMFLGSRNDIAALLKASDIGVLCSHEEGFSNAVLEGMAARLPMVVTQVGGNAEAVIDGETGLVVPAHDPESLATAIVRLANDPALRATFGTAGRERVVQYFGLQRFIEGHRKLYEALAAGRLPRDVPEVRTEVKPMAPM